MAREAAPASARAPGLPAGRLRRRVDPARLGLGTTADVEPLGETVGQPRALQAIDYGLRVEALGHHLFLAGAPGSGRTGTVLAYLAAHAPVRPGPSDWVYVYDFEAPDRPDAIRLPAGRGAELARDLDALVEAAGREIPRAFESEEFERRQREIVAEATRRREELVRELKAFAGRHGYALETTMVGVVSAPVVDGEPLTRERYEQLPERVRAAVDSGREAVEEATAQYLRRLHSLEQEAAARVEELVREVARFATGRLFRELEERWADLPEVLDHVHAVERDVIAHVAQFRGEEHPDELPAVLGRRTDFTRYRVNVLVDNAGSETAPVVVELHPTFYNLLGRIDYRATLGAMVTDFREIRSGALHRANGGFLVLEALDVVRNPFAWDGLKRALRAREIRIENLAEQYSAVPTASLRPEPIPLDVKVVLIGSPYLYALLYHLDEDFRELFGVKADFGPDMPWRREGERAYAAFASKWVRERGLRHLDAAAVARLIEHGGRLRESQDRLSTRLIDAADVITEASFLADEAGLDVVGEREVRSAIARRRYRSSLVAERYEELITEGTLAIDTAGGRVGTVNGIAVIDLGDASFGKPSRVSARVALGRGQVESIEREIELSGPIHSKGFLILTGYLSGTYAQEAPLAVGATITFEQSYDEVEGDSASSTELYALLSALADLPVHQGIGVTGAVDQHGNIRAVGGVNHKIEGFFRICAARGLTGTQGVIVPAANVRHLMLDDEVVEAVARGEFHVWPVKTVDDGLELLTGVKAGRRRADGTFTPGSVHALVQARLDGYARRLEELGTAKDEQPART